VRELTLDLFVKIIFEILLGYMEHGLHPTRFGPDLVHRVEGFFFCFLGFHDILTSPYIVFQEIMNRHALRLCV
jgi:hypothetical protein